jgi:hypothetical protein
VGHYRLCHREHCQDASALPDRGGDGCTCGPAFSHGRAVACRQARPVRIESVSETSEQADRIVIAKLHGTARHHARWRELTEAEHAAAVAELRELAGDRTDLLAHVAGVLEGFGEGQIDEPLTKQAASLCRDAGADPDAIGEWIEEGRRRAAAASLGRSGGLHGGGAGVLRVEQG